MSESRTSTATAARRWVGLVAAVALVVGAAILATSGPSGATAGAPTKAVTSTTCDPAYGCPPTSTTTPTTSPACSLNTLVAAPGALVIGTLTGVPAGTEVFLSFDGVVVAHGIATDGTIELRFRVPLDATDGSHVVLFFGAGFSCDATGGAGFQVKSEAVTKPPPSGNLARTGIQVGLLLAVALVLIVAGENLRRAAKRRRRRQARARNTVGRGKHLTRH